MRRGVCRSDFDWGFTGQSSSLCQGVVVAPVSHCGSRSNGTPKSMSGNTFWMTDLFGSMITTTFTVPYLRGPLTGEQVSGSFRQTQSSLRNRMYSGAPTKNKPAPRNCPGNGPVCAIPVEGRQATPFSLAPDECVLCVPHLVRGNH